MAQAVEEGVGLPHFRQARTLAAVVERVVALARAGLAGIARDLVGLVVTVVLSGAQDP
jgi:hypothetical protein